MQYTCNFRLFYLPLLIMLALSLNACGSGGNADDTTFLSDTGGSSNPNTVISNDAAPDVPANTVPDAPANTVPEAPANTVPEAPANTVPEAPSNTVPDAPSNTVPDAPSNAVPDTPQNDGVVVVDQPLSSHSQCQDQIPCVWSSTDSGVLVTIDSVQTDTQTGRLAIAYTVLTSRDTELQWSSAASAVDSVAQHYTGITPEVIGDTQGADTGSSLELLAGIPRRVLQSFPQSPAHGTKSIERLSIGFIESGVSFVAGFLDLPLNALTGEEIDCNNEVPCIWSPTEAQYTVAVVQAGGLLSNNRLTVNFQVTASVDLVVQLNSRSVAISNTGTAFSPKLHSLGNQSNYLPFDSTIFADTVLSGTQTYLRTMDTTATSLKRLMLDVMRVDVPGAKQPVFINVPLD